MQFSNFYTLCSQEARFFWYHYSTVDSRGAGAARAPPEFGGSEKEQSLISTYRSIAITTNTSGFKKAIYGTAD